MRPSLEQIKELRSQGNVIPIYKSVAADSLTPVSAFLTLQQNNPYAFLLESVEGGNTLARYSFLGSDPFLVCSVGEKKPVLEIQENRHRHFSANHRKDFFSALRSIMNQFHSVRLPELPPFTGGAVGYFGYEMVQLVEDIPSTGIDDLAVEDAILMFFKTILAFDHSQKQIHIISNIFIEETDQPLEVIYEEATQNIKATEKLLQQPLDPPRPKKVKDKLHIRSNFSKQSYLDRVEKAKRYITAGDIFQVVLSQRFEVELAVEPFEIYRALRVINPSPYMYFLKIPDTAIVGASPEMLLKIRDRKMHYRPIAGTRPRGVDESEDCLLAEELAHDEKERAEHIMLVDLGRNDLGRVSEYGTVNVDDFMVIERYSHVMHLVSSLSSHLREDVDRFDALMACFPAGTVSGAPKIRAMEIINESEPTKRGVYAGAILYADFNDNLDSCIAIRTLVAKDGIGYIQAGGGIVADSLPENEFVETINKAKALIQAVELATKGFKS